MRKPKRIPCPCCRGAAPTEPMQRGYKFVWRDWEGVTLGWSAKPEIGVISGYACERCGEVYKMTGHYIPRLGKRDETGWPLTLDGGRMPLASAGTYREREWPRPTACEAEG